MLDTFIIERIRKERERERESANRPIQIERAPPREAPPRVERREKDERGSAIIDFSL